MRNGRPKAAVLILLLALFVLTGPPGTPAQNTGSSSSTATVAITTVANTVYIPSTNTTTTGPTTGNSTTAVSAPAANTVLRNLTIGYLTAARGKLDNRQGLAISGALTLALKEIEDDPNLLPNVSLVLKWDDTHGETVHATKTITKMICDKVAVFFGPEGNTCYTEAIVAQAWNIPMISYKCADYKASQVPTFARTEPPDTQITKSIISLLRYYNWKKFSIITEEPWKNVAESLKIQALSANMTINHFLTIVDPHQCCEQDQSCCNVGHWYSVVQETMVNTRKHGGRSDITQHVTKVKKHLLALSAASKHEKVTSFFLKNDPSGSTDESRRTAAQEEIFAFHTVVHNHSFRSMDCTSSLLKQMYNKKFTCARTKAESIVLNVLAPFAMQQICKEIENINFATIMIDTSNHKNLKIVPILIRYFKPNSGIQIKVFEVTNLKGETANILSTYIIESLKKHKLSDKIVAFSGDNCNTNFGGVLRKGSNNVFSILNNNLKTNIFGVGCAAHILHNAMQSSADVLPIDVEIIVNKIFQFFHIYTVRVEHLKEFCEYANVEYKNILGSVKTRWLSLLPAITRIIDIYPGLKSYFEKQEKCPTILKSFFNDPMSIVWFHFSQSQLKVVCDTVTKIEGDKISACEVAEELEILVGKIKNRKNLNFLTTNILLLLNDLKNNNMYNENSFKKSTDLFYNTFLSYVEKWGCHFDQLKIFRWVQLINCPTW